MSKTIKSKLKFQFKKLLFLRKNIKLHHNSYISNTHFKGSAEVEPFTRIIGDTHIEIGDNFYVNCFCHFLGDIEIGSNVMIGPQTIIWSRDHGMNKDQNMRDQAHKNNKIIIGDDVWIGANVTILRGVSIGSGSVVGAGSVVTKNIPEKTIVVGNPAEIIKKR